MSWPKVALSELCEINIGKTPARANADYWGIGYPWLSIADMNQGLKLSETKEQITDCAVKETNIKVVPKGTVLFSFKLSIGKIGVTQIPMYTNEAIAALPILDERRLCKEYLVYALSRIDASKTTDRAVMGATLNKKKLAELKIPLPPLAEQKRIAAILDKADAIRRKRQQAIQLADEFLRSVFLDMFGDPVTNPKGWEVKLLKDISRIQIGPFGTQLHKEDYIQGGIPIINPTHIVRGHIVSKDDFTITAAKHASLPEYHLDIGDIIMGRRGEMGRCAVISTNEKGWLCGTGSLFIRPSKKGVFSEYLNRLLASDAIKKHLESECQGATMPNLNKTIVGNIQIPVPSDEALNQFSAIKEKIIGTKNLYLSFSREKMFESLSQKTFSGKL